MKKHLLTLILLCSALVADAQENLVGSYYFVSTDGYIQATDCEISQKDDSLFFQFSTRSDFPTMNPVEIRFFSDDKRDYLYFTIGPDSYPSEKPSGMSFPSLYIATIGEDSSIEGTFIQSFSPFSETKRKVFRLLRK